MKCVADTVGLGANVYVARASGTEKMWKRGGSGQLALR
jgi:hypothetical protein